MSGSTSGTYSWNLSLAECLVDAYERCGKNFATLEQEHIRSGVRSLNLVLVSWANRGVNLWTVAEFSAFMPQGVIQYPVLPQVIDVLADSVILRQYQMGAPTDVAPDFSTVIDTPTITISGFTATPVAGQYINVGVPVSIGGLIISGFYLVVSVPGSGECTITAASNATATASNAGTVPSFTSSIGSNDITTVFADHGLLAGQTFTVQVNTTVGGINLLGLYTVATVPDANTFTFDAGYPAGSAQTVAENSGETQLSTPTVAAGTQSANPTDIMLYPLSRGDYMAIPQKLQQGRPTSFWDDRLINGVLNVWPVPDANGPYELRFKASQQIQDADIVSGQTLDVPYRFLEAFVATVASHLSMKFAPERTKDLMEYSETVWNLAANEDRERVSSFLTPDMSSYFH